MKQSLASRSNPVSEYMAAKADQSAAERQVSQSHRIWRKLESRMSFKRAFLVAGVQLAEERCLAAYRAEGKAAKRLMDYKRELGRDLVSRIMVNGVLLCAYIPTPAND